MNINFDLNVDFNANMRPIFVPQARPRPPREQLILEPGNSPNNLSISFDQLGSYVYGNPVLLPTPPQNLPPAKKQVSKDASYVMKLSRETCQEALLAHIKNFCCKGSRAAKDGHINECWSYNAIEYQLDTFNQVRYIGCAFSATSPGAQLSGRSGPLPNPWALPCQPNQMFVEHKKIIPLPNTDTVQPCFACSSNGALRCRNCGGTGRCRCGNCGGSGRSTATRSRPDGSFESYTVTCGSCGGSGQVSCFQCGASGVKTCHVCNGCCHIKWYLHIICHFVNHHEEYLKDKSDLPDELLKTVRGDDLCRDEGVALEPILDSDKEDIVQNTTRLIQKSNQAYGQELRVFQRHVLTVITCAECKFSYNGKDYKFYVYGNEKKVHFPDYPGGCCCCCCCPPCCCCTVQ